MRSVLITGFGPFPGMPRNPTADMARRLAALRLPGLEGMRRTALILPTEWSALERLARDLAANPPDAMLMLGVAGRRTRINVETRAVNDARGLDATRHRPARRLSKSGTSERRAAASVPRLRHALTQAGLSARASRDAGRYLCNGAYYIALEALAPARVPVVFIHLPGRGPDSRRPAARTAVALSLVLRALLRG
ncbi:peptidase C15 [Aquabacter cavernae]|uniref:pyroglutamyl-peptidase I family protein n=1 Tax=Aquabacter cavernae TaxID=2496029 RepID=UPI000F8F6669|nr:peptidase C15 [Aquabacter cavernae]